MNSQSMDTRKKTGKLLFEIGILIISITAVAGLGVYQAILNNWRIGTEGEVFFQAFIQSGNSFVLHYLNQESLYIQVLSVFFSFLGNKEELVLIINLILQLLGIVFFFYGAKRLCSYKLSMMVLFASIVTSIAVYPLNIDTPMHLIWMLCGFIFWLCTYFIGNFKGMYAKYILPGIIIGISCYVDIAGFFLFVAVSLLLLISKAYSRKDKFLQFILYVLCVINGFFVMFYLWNNLAFNNRLFIQWLEDRLSPFYTEIGLYQNVSMGILLIICIIFSLVSISSSEDIVADNVVENVAIKESISMSTNDTNSQEIVTEKNNINASLEKRVEREDVKPINYIPNPLPLPKKHVKKEMNYAFEPSPDMMHYDYNNYRFDDDYDLKDI